MPIYEYISESDGAVIELIRPMAEADAPVEDPENKGRTFRRKLSSFSAKGGAVSVPISNGPGGCCPCGKNQGACGRV